uniref:Uncharacterized protein n=1 Tax=uncultured Desulfobacterium sp. TaxID=201089 RepID=E1YCR0_9BACT|nr:unknown protein [uncultured Desulfobacterium sp.]
MDNNLKICIKSYLKPYLGKIKLAFPPRYGKQKLFSALNLSF